MKKIIVAGLLVAGFASPAFAGTNYYVEQNSKSHHCKITTKQPTGDMAAIGGTFGSRADAKKAMKADSVCK